MHKHDMIYVTRLTVLPHLFDKDVAAATEAALMANLHLTKRKSQVQGVLGEAIREFRQSLVLGEPVPLNHTVAELDDLFSAKQSMPMSATPTTSGSTLGSQVDAVQPALDIGSNIKSYELDTGSVKDEAELISVQDEKWSCSHCIAYTVNKEWRYKPLFWPVRFNIALGVAKGLTYTYHECTDLDSKLLDSKFQQNVLTLTV